MLPVTLISASSMQYNASCFPVHTLGRSNGLRGACGLQLTATQSLKFVIVFGMCFVLFWGSFWSSNWVQKGPKVSQNEALNANSISDRFFDTFMVDFLTFF